MVSREKKEIDDFYKEIEKFIADQPERIQKIQDKAQEFNIELRHLVLVHTMGENNPVVLRNTLKKMDVLKANAYDLIKPIEEESKDADKIEKFLTERKEEYSKLAEDKLLADSALISNEYVKVLTDSLNLIISARQILSIEPLPINNFLLKLERKRSDVEDELKDSLKEYFFQAMPKHYFTAETWEVAYLVATKWVKFVSFFGVVPSKEQKGTFINFLIKVVAAGLVISFMCYFLLRRLGKKLLKNDILRDYFPFCIFVVFGFSIIINIAISGHYQFGVYRTIAEILFTAGAVSLAGSLRKISLSEADDRCCNMLWILWLVFSAGMMVQTLRIPVVTMIPFFTALLIFSGIFCYFLKRRKMHELERNLCTITTVIMAVLVITALFGLGGVSLLISAIWFMVALNIELGTGFSAYLLRIIHSQKDKSAGLVLLSNMFLPLIFIGLFAFVAIWVSVYIGGIPLVKRLIEWKIDWGMVSLRATTVLTLAASFFITRSVISLVHSAIKMFRRRWENIEEGVIKSLQTLSSYILWFLYILVSLNFMGIGISNLALIAGGLSVGIGFALQELIKNFVSGLILLFGRSIHPGDEIQLEDVRGRVERINIRSTVVQTNEDSTIFIPNSDMVYKKIVNWTHRDPKGRAEIIVGVAYGSDTVLIKDILVQCALSNPDVLKEPPPYVLFNDFGESALIFHLRFWVMHVILSKDKVRSAIRFEIDRIFKEHNIEISYPQHDVHIRSVDGPILPLP